MKTGACPFSRCLDNWRQFSRHLEIYLHAPPPAAHQGAATPSDGDIFSKTTAEGTFFVWRSAALDSARITEKQRRGKSREWALWVWRHSAAPLRRRHGPLSPWRRHMSRSSPEGMSWLMVLRIGSRSRILGGIEGKRRKLFITHSG